MKKQKFIVLPLFVLILSFVAIRPAQTFAATTNVTGGTNGPLCNSGGYFTPSSVTVTSGDTITFSVPSNDPYAGGVQVNGFPQGSFVVPRGSSITTQALTANVSYQGTWPGDPSCIKGSGTVTVQAPASSPTPPSSGSGSSSSSSSTNPTSSSTQPSSSSTPTSKATTKSSATPTTSTPSTSTAQPTTAPETVVADTITVAGKKVTPAEGQGLTINQAQPLVLSGTTVPNGKITLTIHSNPITATIQADASGNWNYTVTSRLPAGNHTIYAAVTDPTTNQTSATSKLLAFVLKDAPVASVTHTMPMPMKKHSSLLMLVIIGLIAVLIIAAIIVFVMKKKDSKDPLTPSSVISPTPIEPQGPAVEPQQTQDNVNPQQGAQIMPAPDVKPGEVPKDSNS